MKHLLIILGFVCLLTPTATSFSQEIDSNCDQEVVTTWILNHKTFTDRFEELDEQISGRLTDFRGIPRLDLIVAIQQVRREFEATPYPSCAGELFHSTVLYWVQRIDHLTMGMNSRQVPDSRSTTSEFYQTRLLPAIANLESTSGVDFFAIRGETRPEGFPTPIPVTVGEIIIQDQTTDQLIAVDEFKIPNCDGTAPLTLRRERNRTIERQIRFYTDAQIEAEFGIAVADLHGRVQTQFELENNETVSESTELEMTAAPGTTVIYQIRWLEVSTRGLIEITKGDRTEFVPFAITDSIRPEIQQPIQAPCVETTEQAQDD